MKSDVTIRRLLMLGCLVMGGLAGAWIPLSAIDGMKGGGRENESENAAAPTSDPKADEEATKVFTGPVTTEQAAGFAETEPRAFLRWMLKADPQPSQEIVNAFFTAWIGKDPDAALEAALRLPARFGYGRESQFFPREVQLLFRRDPMTALRWAGRIEGAIGHDITLHVDMNSLKVLEPLDPEDVRIWLNRSPVGGVSVGMARTFSEMLAQKDPAAAARWAASLNVEYQNAVLPMMLYHLSKQDPQAAMEYIKNGPSNIRQFGALYALSSKDTSALKQIQWLEEEMGLASYTGLNNVLSRFYHEDKKGAIAHVTAMEGTTQGVEAVRGLAEAACMNGPTKDAVAMIATLPTSMQLDAARAAMFMRMPGDFPAFLAPLSDGSLDSANLDGYMDLLVSFVDGERGRSFGRDDITWSAAEVPEHLKGFQDWLRENPGELRDRFIRRTAESLKEKPELRERVFGKLPAGELERVLGEK